MVVWRICASSAGGRNVTDFDRNVGSFYVKYALGRNDGSRDLLGGVSWKYGRSDERAAGLGEGGGDTVSHNAGDHVILVRDLKDWGESGTHRGADREDAAGDKVSLSEPAGRTSGGEIYCDKYDREHAGARLGGDTGWVKGDGRAGKAGGRAAGGKSAG